MKGDGRKREKGEKGKEKEDSKWRGRMKGDGRKREKV